MKTLIPSPLLLLALLLLSSGCQEETPTLKKPTQLGLRLSLGTDYLPPSDGLTLKEGHLVLSSIVLKGERLEGEPFQFERNFPGGLSVDFDGAEALDDLVFDVPMGDYRQLTVVLETVDGANGPSCWIGGQYQWLNPPRATAAVELSWQRVGRFEVDLLAGTHTRVLDEQPQAPQIVFQPYGWLTTTDPNKWDRADYDNTAQGRLMRINKIDNNNLFALADPLWGTLLTTQW